MALAMIAVILLVVLAATAMLWPLWRARETPAAAEGDISLEIAREAKLGELSDLEHDFRLGKLSAHDFRVLNATLRGEAIDIIRQIDAAAPTEEPPAKVPRP
jgi:hypothetical protein